MKFESGLRNTLERLWNPLTLDAQMLCALQWLLFRSPHVKLMHTAGGLSLYDFMLSMVLLWHHYHRNQWPDWYLNHHQPVSFQILDQLLDQRSAKKQLTIVPHDIPWSLPPTSFCARLASKMGGPIEKNNGMRKKPSNSGCPQCSVFLSPFRLLRRPGAGSLRSFTRLKGTTTGNHGFIMFILIFRTIHLHLNAGDFQLSVTSSSSAVSASSATASKSMPGRWDKKKWNGRPQKKQAHVHILYIYIYYICICIRTWMLLVVACCFLLCCLLLLVLRLLFVFTHPPIRWEKIWQILPSLRETHEGNAVGIPSGYD